MIFPNANNYTFSTYLTDAVGDTLFLKPVTQAEIVILVNNTQKRNPKIMMILICA